MSGRHITDMGGYPHTSDMAMKSKNKVSHERSCSGAGHLGSTYPDTTEEIYRDQEAGIRHAEGRKMKPGYRN
jgi:hypothetical protein